VIKVLYDISVLGTGHYFIKAGFVRVVENTLEGLLANDECSVSGFVPDNDLSALYSGALAFADLSLYEGSGLPLLEAMQCGVPVITSNTSSLPEVVGSAGIMVPPDDGDGICQAMLGLYRDSNRRAELAVKSLERASLFSWERSVRETVDAYKKALNS
jgi:glycosyltransferase involved in cell wall biosynthesis